MLQEAAFLAEPPDDATAGAGHALYLLELAPTEETLSRARALVADPHRVLRAGVGRLLGRRGDATDVGRLRALLTDPEERVRSETVVGVWLRQEERPLSREEATALFPALAEALKRSAASNDRQLPALLLALDPQPALALLRSPEVLRGDLGALPGVLDVLDEARAVVPCEALLALVAPIDSRAQLGKKRDDPRPALIALLARHEGQQVDEVLRRYSTGAGSYPAHVAAEERCRRAGLDPEGVIARAEATLEEFPDGLSDVRLVYVLARAFDYEVRNGGLRQFFGNAPGAHARETVAALRSIGCPKSAALLEQAIAEFGPDGPPRDHEERAARRNALRPKEGERRLFDRLDKEVYADDEPVMARAHLWVLDHPEEFRDQGVR